MIGLYIAGIITFIIFVIFILFIKFNDDPDPFVAGCLFVLIFIPIIIATAYYIGAGV